MSDSRFPHDRMGELPAWDDEGFDHFDLEQWIQAAGSYVRVGNQLRAQVIDEVKQEAARRGAWKPVVQFASWGLSAALVWSLSVYLILLVMPRGLTANEIFQRAEKRTETAGISHEWALSEVFTESRHPGMIHVGNMQGVNAKRTEVQGAKAQVAKVPSQRPVGQRPVGQRPVSQRPVSQRPVSQRPVSQRMGNHETAVPGLGGGGR